MNMKMNMKLTSRSATESKLFHCWSISRVAEGWRVGLDSAVMPSSRL